MLLCDPGTVRFKNVYMQAWVRENMIHNNPGKARRRGSWNVKPRQHLRWRPNDEDILWRKDYWEWDTSRCNWWSLLECSESEDAHHFREQFRQQFGVARAVYDQLLDELRSVPGLEDGRMRVDAAGKQRGKRESKPLCIKLLAALRAVTSGISFRKLQEEACISEKSARRSFSWLIVDHIVDHLYNRHVYMPRSVEELKTTESRFARQGFPGAVSDLDGVQIPWNACPAVYAAANTGKEGYPTLGFLVFNGPNGEVQHIHGAELGVHIASSDVL